MSSLPAAAALSETRAETFVAALERAGYARVHPPILQPAEPFLDLSGEDIRRSLYLTTDPTCAELCLRPDLTIPVSLGYLASAPSGPAAYCYLGPVFRYRAGAASEFLQVGVESFGRPDTAAADAEMLALALDAAATFAIPAPQILMGDVGLFAALVDALKLNPAWKRRLVKDFNRKITLSGDLDRLTLGEATPAPEYQGVLAALAGSDRKAAHALVTDLLSIAGATTVGGRSVGEIADRFLEQATLGGAALPVEMRALVERFLAIAGNPDEAAEALRALAQDARLDLSAALDQLELRTGFLAARGVDVSAIRFATAFGRGLDYYTGFEFELHAAGETNGNTNGTRPLAAGGRYDGLLTRLGARAPVPAVGFAAGIDALAAAGGEP